MSIILGAKIDALEKENALLVERCEALEAALHRWSRDMHAPSARPCETCARASKVVGSPVGCDAFRECKRLGLNFYDYCQRGPRIFEQDRAVLARLEGGE